jgi:hypothetical protein
MTKKPNCASPPKNLIFCRTTLGPGASGADSFGLDTRIGNLPLASGLCPVCPIVEAIASAAMLAAAIFGLTKTPGLFFAQFTAPLSYFGSPSGPSVQSRRSCQ